MKLQNRMHLPAFCAILALLLLLCGCTELTPPTEPVESLTTIVTAEDISMLEDYPDLKSADLRGSTCYEAIEQYIARHPEVTVQYTVDLGRGGFAPDTTELVLTPDAFKYDKLMENLKYLPGVTHIEFPLTTLSADELAAIRKHTV